jgi:hypothetical protein
LLNRVCSAATHSRFRERWFAKPGNLRWQKGQGTAYI